jgi:hypothetical protein
MNNIYGDNNDVSGSNNNVNSDNNIINSDNNNIGPLATPLLPAPEATPSLLTPAPEPNNSMSVNRSTKTINNYGRIGSCSTNYNARSKLIIVKF